ncbi:MAG TPA: nuclear transport factor 2 family protein [Chitinophagaceae bacterium]|nr:nuclear transport factor 2 family protein [Chitinophagaceae bacterium]
MKQATVIVMALLLFATASTAFAQQTTQVKKMKKSAMQKENRDMQQESLPYVVTYSSQFAPGKPAQSKRVLDMYHLYETADFSKADWFADTVTVITDQGQVTKGRDAVLEMFKQQRSGLYKITFSMSAVLPTHSIDRNEDWVAVWASNRQRWQATTPTCKTRFMQSGVLIKMAR